MEKVVTVSGYRAKSTLRKLVIGNFNNFPKSWNWRFITFTFNPTQAKERGIDVHNLTDTNKEWKKFRQRLEYHFKERIYYLTVHERHKSGQVHYHTLFFNIPKIKAKDLANIWGNGFIKNKRVKDIKHATNYVTKYIVKEIDDNRVKGKKSYFHNLPHVPQIERDRETITKNIPPKHERSEERTVPYSYKDQNGNEVNVVIKTFIHNNPENPPNYSS